MGIVVIVFGVLAAVSVLAGAAVFCVDSMARATFALLLSFLAAAGTVLLVDLAYLGVLIILMMTIEMVIMVVFMIMYMMNPAGLMPMTMVHNNRGALLISGVTFVVMGAGALLVPWPTTVQRRPADPTVQLGEALMGSKMLVMMVLGLALFATMVGTVVLATNRGRYDRYGDGLDAPHAVDPVRGGIGR